MPEFTGAACSGSSCACCAALRARRRRIVVRGLVLAESAGVVTALVLAVIAVVHLLHEDAAGAVPWAVVAGPPLALAAAAERARKNAFEHKAQQAS